MKFGGIQKTSLLDYPGKISTILFTIGCPYRCHFCYNPELVKEPFSKEISTKEIFKHLDKRKKLIEAIVITGGEPTLHNDLLDFIKEIKKLGFLVKLDTNGYYYSNFKKIVEANLLNYIAMDIKSPLEKYDLVTGVKNSADNVQNSIELIMKSGIDYEFRSTIVPSIHTKEDILKMAELIKGAKKYYLQKFNKEADLIDPELKQIEKTFNFKELNKIAKECKRFVKKCAIR